MARPDERRPARRGVLWALGAALLFGASTPLVQRFGAGTGAFGTAALLYAGAALVGVVSIRPSTREARLLPGDLRRLGWMAAFGAVVGPVSLAWGLQRTSATSASLLLTLEALFTALFAWHWYHETMDRRTGSAMALMLAGGILLVLQQHGQGDAGLWGMLAVLLATVAWAVDNGLSRPLSGRDPGRVVMAKSALGAAAAALVAVLSGEALPGAANAASLFAVGAGGYGLSLRMYLRAQRAFGAARTGSVFAFAPFIGAALAVLLGDHLSGWMVPAGGALMLGGVLLHLAESHSHGHQHTAVAHEHAHRHDDGHHDHVHDPMPVGEHSHDHLHDARCHAHGHVPDMHHTHRH